MRKWVALFSQTGSELKAICERLNRYPDLIITNSKSFDSSQWKDCVVIHVLDNSQINSSFYKHCFDQIDPECVVTLHGWLKIIPDDICEQYQIFNGHPGDIVKYPQLRGKDPQKKAFDLKLISSGCILHRCTKELDGGPIVDREEVIIGDCENVDAVISKLRKCSVNMWIKLIQTLL